MATISIPESPLAWDINYTLDGYRCALYFEGREIYSHQCSEDKEFYASQDEFLDVVAAKLSRLLEG
jgi:hypothetical protein